MQRRLTDQWNTTIDDETKRQKKRMRKHEEQTVPPMVCPHARLYRTFFFLWCARGRLKEVLAVLLVHYSSLK